MSGPRVVSGGGKCSELVENGLRVRVYIRSKSDFKWGIRCGGMN